MRYPILNPENVSRDMIDTFGGYNHNLRIGENEFFDMENLSSDSYPLLSVRQKRGILAPIRSNKTIMGLSYRNSLNVVYRSNNNFNLVIDADSDNFHSISWESEDLSSERIIVAMGSYLIVLPDKVFVNTKDEGLFTVKFIDNEKTINSAITIQPCLTDGTVLSVDYIGDEIPQAPVDGFVWGDTRNGTVALKKYIASQAMWQTFLSTYVKISSADPDVYISEGFKEGDGVKISGITGDDTKVLNNTSIIKSIPDDHSLVITGIIDPIPNHYLLTARWNGSDNTREFYCDQSVGTNEFAGKKILIGNNEYLCTENTQATEISADYQISDMDLVNEDYTHSSGELTVDRAVEGNNIVYVDEEINRKLFPVDKKEYKTPVLICVDGDTSKTATILSYGSVKDGAGRTDYLVLDKNITAAVGKKIYPVEIVISENVFSTVMTFESAVTTEAGDRACPSVDNQYAQTGGEVKISRKMPKMDFVIESGNRLWGCRYGENLDGDFVNEIYCSKLGDPTNWNVYEGIATDSYAASCGTEGEWTGAFNYRGYPTFFKEHHIHTVYGSNPPFQIKDTEARGIQKDSSSSLALLNEVLFYKSVHGICAYTGGLPEEVSGVLGDMSYQNAVGCAYRGKYYVEMQDTGHHPALFVFDTVKGLWHKESAINAVQMAASDDNLIYTAPVDDKIGIGYLFGNTENSIRWYAETGILGLSSPDKKYISKINLRLMLPVGSSVFISIEYDSSGRWERMTNIIGHSLMPFSFSIKPRRCDHFRLKLEGIGDMKLYSISKTIEQGSDR